MNKRNDAVFEMPNGTHRGESIMRVPAGYLLWMVRVRHIYAEEAQIELDRRGTKLPDFEVSVHAVDRASTRCLDLYQAHRHKHEGIFTWLGRMAQKALNNGTKQDEGDTIHYRGMRFAFTTEENTEWPILTTVSRVHSKSRKSRPVRDVVL